MGILCVCKGVIDLHKLEELLEWGGTKKDVIFLVISGAALLFGKQQFFLAVCTEISAKNPACKYRRDAKAYAMS